MLLTFDLQRAIAVIRMNRRKRTNATSIDDVTGRIKGMRMKDAMTMMDAMTVTHAIRMTNAIGMTAIWLNNVLTRMAAVRIAYAIIRRA